MSSLSSLTAQPRKLRVGEKTYDLFPLTLEELGQLQGWVDSQFPDPIQVVADAIGKGNYTVAQQQYLMKQALELASRPKSLIGTPEADRLLQSTEGTKRLLLLSIRKGRPDFTEAEAAELLKDLNGGHVEAAFSATGVDQVIHDPKGSKTTRPGNGTSTSRPSRRRPG